MKQHYDFYTYEQGRACLHCNLPIADQVHANTEFCRREELPDGSIKACKDDFHALKNKEKNAPYLEVANFHKDANQRIGKLLADKGETVTIEHLNQYGIRLDKPFQMKTNAAQKTEFYLLGIAFPSSTNHL